MRLAAEDFRGRVTFITGPEKHCGKTTFLNACLAAARREGERAAFLGIGFDGEARDALSGLRKPRIAVAPGEVFVSAERYLRPSGCLPEVLDVLPGSTALGRLAIARARRAGAVTLVGPERNELASFAISRIVDERWARTVFVDGAINRITQVAAFAGARFVFALRVSPSDIDRQARRMRLIHALLSLPVLGGAGELGAPGGEPFFVEGPLTSETAKRLPPEARSASVEDFTKVFLEGPALAAFLRERKLYLRHGCDFGGFSVVLRDMDRGAFEHALGDAGLISMVSYNPYESPMEGAA